jgi:signal transduction histidine kinase
VIDTGIGIAQEHLPHIFQPFYRVVSQVEGTGLGLNISKEIVELHDGQIGVESTLKQGSRFYFSLPLVHAPVPADDPILPEQHSAHS